MTRFRVAVHITPRRGILDPQGKAVAGALKSLGFDGVDHVHVGRLVTLSLTAGSASEAEDAAVALHTLGFGDVKDVRVGRHVIVETEAGDEQGAQGRVRDMCEKLLANPVTEDFEIAGVSRA